MRKKRIDRDIVVILIMSVVTVCAWIGFEVYRAYSRRNIPPVLSKQLMELTPKLDISILGRLESRTP
ncbi:MAG: hypothetical protein UX80_C0007G0012 [Candidatus Amesbacteria bacterium GW2011_GWA2_47_11b]|uniref:Uncharacterized protein n=3 Tax=Candidatus Amesiibacteriota TaxID=1752730 RepID=A0A0G1VIU4_9BACT|nr:MAG: hypothetical protein UX42_C0005G0011 [Microgenomates group bacterium GW2011_GWC1_46_20]KKU57983.1 MAG: hypothetical protein UX80_C0007G0012 [Candidatus Amesbacteria bacterium GW2011_GWA2_47_11b]KKU69990.1 MAG: hypothetical protein UX92_C0006G0037 [Candidatus Amesbacteria bacterium GW2011_GWA1_47_20]KKU84873.1 MAG: hypothetical protein UY11_C0002G0028 [Candidatus Amesbacteria bacterium GW2011_GWC2_47_8]